MKSLGFTVPWSALCSDNRKFVSGQFILTKEYRESKTLIGQLSLAAARKAKWGRAEGPLALEVVVREPDRRRRDLNWSKNCKDGITAGEGVWWDDSQVRVECWRFVEPPDKSRAGAVVTITQLDKFPDAPDTDTHGDAAVGRSDELREPAAAGLQRARRVRRGAAAADQPPVAGAGRAKRGRGEGRAADQRGARGAVSSGAGAVETQARPVRASSKAARATAGDAMGGADR
jgi:Holliday junction resolvase RusA-like endonuclease